MRLYISKKEIPVLKKALADAAMGNPKHNGTLKTIYDRVALCEQLQGNIEKAERVDKI